MDHCIKFAKKIQWFLLLSLVSLVAVAADAPATASLAAKVGVLDWQRLISTAPQAKEASKRFEAEFQGPSQKLNEKQSEFQSKRAKLQRDQSVLSAAEQSKKEKELLKLEQEIRRMDEELRAESTTRHREEMDNFIKIVREVVEKFGQEQSYDAILSHEVMVYYADRIDITDQILERLQKMPKSAKKAGS